jgi:phosphatidylserine decarboxylase
MIEARTIREAIPPVHREGWPFIAVAVALAVSAAFVFAPAFWLLAVVTGWMVVFFRDPKRVVPVAPGLVVSPADGRIEPVVRAAPPPELGMGPEPRTRISIFMSVFDCHINRAPAGGRVKRIAYRPGKFLSADLDKASDANERNSLLLDLGGGTELAVVQIAGLVARRIKCWTRDGAELLTGERIGMIRFGSRLDVYLPEGSVVLVNRGQRAIAAETVIAVLPGNMPAAPYAARLD